MRGDWKGRAVYYFFGLLVGILVTLFLGPPCEGAEPPHLRLRTTITVLTAGAALDLASTEWAFNQGPGIREAGLGQSLTGRAALKVGGVAAEAWVISKLKPRWQRRALIGITVLNVGISGWNIHQGRKAGRAR